MAFSQETFLTRSKAGGKFKTLAMLRLYSEHKESTFYGSMWMPLKLYLLDPQVILKPRSNVGSNVASHLQASRMKGMKRMKATFLIWSWSFETT